jgi:uncharacterized protein (DUF488 family)
MEIYTIGFTGRKAKDFFGLLKEHKIKQLIDIRLNNVSQLAGFTKRDDLEYFLSEICKASYRHEPLLAPTKEILDAYRKKQMTWEDYEVAFFDLMKQRRIETTIKKTDIRKRTVLLCSEPTAAKCHRRLVAEYLAVGWRREISIIHL